MGASSKCLSEMCSSVMHAFLQSEAWQRYTLRLRPMMPARNTTALVSCRWRRMRTTTSACGRT